MKCKVAQEIFIFDLKEGLKLDDGLIKNIRLLGVVGVRKGNRYLPQNYLFELKEYLEVTNPQKKRHHYCHCPRI